MNTGRVLGRGRVLGNARSPPPQPPPPQPSASPSTKPRAAAAAGHKRIPSYISPSSDSSTSLTSQLSTSTVQDGLAAHDLVSNVSLALPDNAAAANASSRLICPICNEQMVRVDSRNHVEASQANVLGLIGHPAPIESV
jgi:rabenosyn-5